MDLWMAFAGGVAAGVVGTLLVQRSGILSRKFDLGSLKVASGSDVSRCESLRQNLRVKFMYDENKVDRAVAFERERDPHGKEDSWLRAAVDRWEQNNR